MRSIMAQLVASAAVLAPQALGLSGAAWQMVMDSTAWQDPWWDESLGMLYDPSSATAMTHSTLGSAWYAVGLLARNGNNGQDAQNADRIINYIIGGQFQGTENFWYGDYNKESEEPLVGTPVYPPSEYGACINRLPSCWLPRCCADVFLLQPRGIPIGEASSA